MFYLMTHSTHFIYGYKVSDIWLKTTQIARKETYFLCAIQQSRKYVEHWLEWKTAHLVSQVRST